MNCSYELCGDPIKNPQGCKGCKNVLYCSTNCRIQDFYKNHKKVCSGRPERSPDVSVISASSKSALSAYEITNKVLGSGSYGEVKLVKHKKTGELSALKIIKKDSLQEDKIPIDLILREISIHTTLSHPNIIKLKESFSDSSSIYLVLEYAENGSLFEKIKENGRIDEIQAKAMHRQIIEAVKHLHLNCIVHRDIKPENVLIDSEGTIKICDFGWCVKGEEARSTFCGTLDYMAPEMIKGQNHSYEIDIWALGVLLYEMLHGYPPFQGTKESEKCFNIANCKYKFGDWVSNDAKDLIKKMIQKVPGNRIHLESALNHPFFNQSQNSSGLSVGDSFRFYVKDFGMDDGVVEEISSDCLVRFKKTGKKVRMNKSDVLRRVKKVKNVKNSGEELSQSSEKCLINEYKIDVEKKNLDNSHEKKKFFMLEEQLGGNFLSANQSINNSPSSSFSKHFSLNQSLASCNSERMIFNFDPQSANTQKFSPMIEKVDDSILSNLSEKLGKLAEFRKKEKELTEPSTGKSVLSEAKSENSESVLNVSQEDSIYHNINKWIKAPVRRKRKLEKKLENIEEKDRSLDKRIDKFKGLFIDPVDSLTQSPNFSPKNVLLKLNLEKLPEKPEEQESSYNAEPDNDLMKKLKSNMKNNKEKHLNPFSPSSKRNQSIAKTPRFPLEAIPGMEALKEDDSSDNEISLNKGSGIFEEEEKELIFGQKENLNINSPMSKNLNINSPMSKNLKSAAKQPEKIPKKNSFNSWREKLELNHEEFYQEIDQNLLDEKKSVIKAKEILESEENEKSKRTFTQYDEYLKGFPSVISNNDVSVQVSEQSNLKLKKQKKNLEQIILDMDKVDKLPIRRPKKQFGFFGWIGKLMGCNERY